MRGSWKIGSLVGVGVYMHWTFLLLLGWVLFSPLAAGQGVGVATLGVVLIISLFGCVVLHELGHALMARRFGVETQDITLLPIGGVARLERIPENPRQELAIALAGPAVNVAIAGCLALLLSLFSGIVPLSNLTLAGGSLLSKLMWINLSLAVFNLLPAFPMDGGRVLRALLAFRTTYGRATQIAASVGQAMAVLFGAVGLFGGNLMLMLIALFIVFAGQQEAAVAQLKEVTRGLPVRDAMSTDFHLLRPHDSIEDAAKIMMRGYRSDFPIVSDDEVVGILTHGDVLKAVARRESDLFVADMMHEECPTISENEPLTAAIEQMGRQGCSSVAVLHNGKVVGILAMEQLGEWVAMHSALAAPSSDRRTGTIAQSNRATLPTKSQIQPKPKQDAAY